jgi:hypothetical protein
MLKILGEQYFINVDEIENFITLESNLNSSGITENSISITRYEMIKMMLDTILTENETIDETLGIKSSGISISFKFAFNTLLNKNIISKY